MHSVRCAPAMGSLHLSRVRWLALCGLVAVHAASAQTPLLTMDGDGDTVRLRQPARRVVSLVPDATDLLIDIGALSQIVGRTQYDAEPELDRVPSMGGTVTPDLERVRALDPDLVIVGTGEKRAATRAMLRQMGLSVYAAPIHDTASFFQSARALGLLVGRDSSAAATITRVRNGFSAVRASATGRTAPTVAFIITSTPPTTTGPTTYIAELIRLAGGKNVFDDATADWPRVSIEQIVHRSPDIVLVVERDTIDQAGRALQDAPGWRSLAAAHHGRIVAVPADLIDRPGPRMPELARIFRRAFDLVP